MKRLFVAFSLLLFMDSPHVLAQETQEISEADSLFIQGQIFARQKEYNLALDAYINALSKDPKHEKARISLAILLGMQKEYAKGLKEIDSVLKLYPRSYQAHKVKARLLHDSKKYAEAAAAYEQYLALIPPNLLKDREEVEKEIAMLKSKSGAQ